MIEDIFVTSQGEVAKTVLDGIAAFFNSGSGDIFYWVTGMIGTFAVLFRFYMRQELRQMFIWLASFTILATILIEGKRDLIIHDQTKPIATYHVDNVPLGLALPLSSITGISSYLTDKLEGIMNIPGDMSYEKNGMIWGANLYSQMKEARINPELLNYWSRFLARCVWLDIKVRHKYSFNDLANAPDVLDFLTENTKAEGGYARVHIPGANPGEPGAEDFPRCGPALRYLKEKFKEDALFNLESLSKFNANAMTKNIAAMKTGIENTYDHFFGLSSSAQNIMMQNLAMNAIRDGFHNIATSKNATAAALNYTKTQGQMARTSSWISIGVMAQEYIPMLHTILMLLLCCAFIPIVYMAFFPSYTLNIISKYLGGFIWLGTWPMFFVFISFIMNTILATHLKTYTGSFDGLTLSNMDAVESLTWRYAGLTGYLIAFVPYLSRMLIMGAGSAMMGVATSMTQQTAHDAEKGAQGMSEGSFRLAELSVSNANMNNISGHQHNLRPTEMIGGSMHQSLSGGTINQSATGQIAYDNSSMIDKQPFDFRQGESVATGLSQTQSMHESNRITASQLSQENYAAGLNTLNQTGVREGLNHVIQNAESSGSVANLA